MGEGYKQYLKSGHWKYWRKRKLKNKKHCFVCYSTEQLEVHHLKYRNLFDIKSVDIKVMCHRCHGLLHKLLGNGTIKFENDNHKSKMVEISKLIRPIIGVDINIHKNQKN